MKKILFLLFAISAVSLSAQNSSTRGTDFWCTFLETLDIRIPNQTISVIAIAPRTCSVTLTNPNTNWSQTFSLSPNAPHQSFIPLSEGHNTLNETITQTGIHVTSTDTITLFMVSSSNDKNMDLSNVIPTNHLLSEYMIQTFPTNQFSSIFSIVSTQNNTNIDITLGGTTLDGTPAGTILHVTLPNAGDVYTVKGLTTGDLSGTHIISTNNKPIAVFNGDMCANVPYFTTGCSCDHAFEQAFPTNYLGSDFIIPASADIYNYKDNVIITAFDNNCHVYINGNHVTTLASGDSYNYTMSSTTAVDHIQTSGKAIVNLYFPSTNSRSNGDPAMTTIIPIEQSISQAQFDVLQYGNISSMKVIIVCETSNISNIRYDGNNVSQFQPIPNASGFSLARITTNSGYHQIDDIGGNGFVAYVYAKGYLVSYGFNVGMALHNLGEPDLLVDNIHAKNHPEGFDVCLGDTVNFSIAGNIALDTVMWDFGNNESSSENPTSCCYRDDTSSYNVSVRIVYTPDTNYPSIKTVDTLHTTIHVHPTYNFSTSDTIVQNQLPWTHNAHTFTSACDSFTFQNQTLFGCDSIERYSLFVWKNDTTRFDTIICDTILPFTWNGFTFEGPGSQNELLQNSHGADSLIIYSLDTITCTIPTTYAYFDTTVCDTLLPFLWHDTLFNIPKSYIIKTRNVEGGDSIVTLTLDTMHCSLYHPQIWVPNVFTPENDINQVFKIYYKDLIEASVVIYQRWGDFVTRFDALTESWDGTKNGIPCQQGAYVYHITYRTMEHPKEVKTLFGSILLLR